MRLIGDVVRALASQDRALSNARAATTRLLRGRVERQDVELYLADRETVRRAAVASTEEEGHARASRGR